MFISDLIGATTIFDKKLSRGRACIKVCDMQFPTDLVGLQIITLEVKSCGAERHSPSAHIATPQGLGPSQALASRNKQTDNSVPTSIVLTLGYAFLCSWWQSRPFIGWFCAQFTIGP